MTTSTTSGMQESGQGFIPGVFDVERLMQTAATQPVQREALLALMDKVCSVARRDMEGAWHAWREGQPQQSAAMIHSLRGSIGALGASIFSATSRELEAAVRNGEATELQFNRAQGELQAAVDAALAWLARQPRQESDAVADSGAAALARWKDMLAEHNIDAVALYRQVRPSLASLGQASAGAIDEAMARLDFATVLHLLGEQP